VSPPAPLLLLLLLTVLRFVLLLLLQLCVQQVCCCAAVAETDPAWLPQLHGQAPPASLPGPAAAMSALPHLPLLPLLLLLLLGALARVPTWQAAALPRSLSAAWYGCCCWWYACGRAHAAWHAWSGSP
jgi:hypothetical protein